MFLLLFGVSLINLPDGKWDAPHFNSSLRISGSLNTNKSLYRLDFNVVLSRICSLNEIFPFRFSNSFLRSISLAMASKVAARFGFFSSTIRTASWSVMGFFIRILLYICSVAVPVLPLPDIRCWWRSRVFLFRYFSLCFSFSLLMSIYLYSFCNQEQQQG
mgnify:CR=1 FL=1